MAGGAAGRFSRAFGFAFAARLLAVRFFATRLGFAFALARFVVRAFFLALLFARTPARDALRFARPRVRFFLAGAFFLDVDRRLVFRFMSAYRSLLVNA